MTRKSNAEKRDINIGLGILCLIFTACFCTRACEAIADQAISRKKNGIVTMTIVYDNNSFRPDLRAAWGFACFIEGLEKTILFDTGGDGRVLLSNMEKLGISPEKIDFIFLSHVHGDHTGGLGAVLERNHNVTVFLPASFPETMKAAPRSMKAKVIEVKNPMSVCQDAFSTGEMGTLIKEQALYVRVRGGMGVITGCAHPGIVKIVSKASELSEAVPCLVTGGFHMGGWSKKRIESVISDFKKLGVMKVAPCHCSGDRSRKMFSEAFRSQFIKAGVGSVVTLEPAP